MENKLQRPVSIGEVIMRTHTRQDETYVDSKAKLIGETYEKNLRERICQRLGDPSLTSDGTSQAPDLTADEMNEFFISSTIDDERGNLYGLRRLAHTHGKGKDRFTSSSIISDLRDQLKAAQQRIDEQYVEHKRRDEETARREDETLQQKNYMDKSSLTSK